MNIIPFKTYYDSENLQFYGREKETAFMKELTDAAGIIISDIAGLIGYRPENLNFGADIVIELSDEIIIRQVKGNDTGVLKESIASVAAAINRSAERRLSVIDKLENIRAALDEIENSESDNEDAEASIDKRLSEIEAITDMADLYKNTGIEPADALKLKNLLKKIKKRSFSYTVTGEYKSGKIILYPKGICEYARKKKVSADARMMAVFARELFKAYHHAAVKDSGYKWNSKIWALRSVTGSCASFYERIFSRDNIGDNLVSDTIAKGWRHHDFDTWSVSGAQYIERYDNWSHDLFRKIFMDSMYSWTDAHRDLIACERKTHHLPIER